MNYAQPVWYSKPEAVNDIDDAFEDVSVHPPGMWENEVSAMLSDWYAVSTNDSGIVAYFAVETDALSFRLKIIDRWFNG